MWLVFPFVKNGLAIVYKYNSEGKTRQKPKEFRPECYHPEAAFELDYQEHLQSETRNND